MRLLFFDSLRVRLAREDFVHLVGRAEELEGSFDVGVGEELVLYAATFVIVVDEDSSFNYAAYLRTPTFEVVVDVVFEFLLQGLELSCGLRVVAFDVSHLAQVVEIAQTDAVVGEVVLLHEGTEVGVLLVGEVERAWHGHRLMFGAIENAVVEELRAGFKVGEERGEAIRRGDDVGRDATAVAHDASCCGAKLMCQGVG